MDRKSIDERRMLRCVISSCEWTYEPIFGPQESLELIKMHVEYEHRRPVAQVPAKTTPTECVPSGINMVLDQTSSSPSQESTSAAVLVNHQKNSGKNVPDRESLKTPCPHCSKPYARFTGKNCKAYVCCLDCFRANRNKHRNVVQHSSGSANMVNKSQLLSTDTDVRIVTTSVEMSNFQDTIGSLNHIRRKHPMLTLRICPKGSSKSVTIVGIADTGAQSNIIGYKDFLSCGLDGNILQNATLKIHAANKTPLNVVGGFVATIEGIAPGNGFNKCDTVIYVSKSVTGMYVSFDTLIKLNVVSSDFPIMGVQKSDRSKPIEEVSEVSPVHLLALNSGCLSSDVKSVHCDCPQRSAVPLRPKSLPFAAIPENVDRMKQWLLEHFKSSTFNTCPHQPLQQMSGPPIEIHISESAEPKVCDKPSIIPVHWQEQVEADIKRDEALGILEKVPYGVPSKWCHRMVVTRKYDNTPRRTVDLSPLNKYCKRETYGTESPYHLARRIPPGSWKTVTDAWNGYHSVPLRESDRHLTTFITPFGRWRYTRAPQGFLSSGDGYNRRFAVVLEDFKRKQRCVDDTVHYDSNIEDHWWRTIDLLIKVGQSGIVLNPKKFQFCLKEVEFAGFKITDKKVEPLSKYLTAIQLFPKPTNVTDIRSWFGLVNQVSTYAQLRDLMAPFRPFLSPKTPFRWDRELDLAFEQSKKQIVELIRHGVQIFDLGRWTCLRPDWSKRGLGYFLLQKHCKCEKISPDCCNDGWKTTVAGSRFLSPHESRYAAVEGEALAIVWGLEQTKYFTQGCEKLLVVTDHKPLVGLFEDRTLDEVPNTRLFRLKERTLQWNFKTIYLPGKTNLAADATSRHPSPDIVTHSQSHADIAESLIVASICNKAADISSVSWDMIARETENDRVLSEVMKAISEEFKGTYPLSSEYMRYKNSLYTQDGAVIYQDRVVVPKKLRKVVLDTLHAAHQGTSSMQLRAQSIVFWPGMSRDIAQKRATCDDCNRNAPSQPSVPSEPAIPPSVPFQQIVADFFDFGGHHYLVAADRLSAFSEVFYTPTGTSRAGARGLIICLRKWFQTFGVPEQLSSDGGPEFTADTTQEFLRKWGVSHRISSAYHPQSNGRAEVAVKTVKRLMRSNTSAHGSLDTDRFLRAMLQLRNTPDPDCGQSPSEIVFGRLLRDNLSFTSYKSRATYSRRWQNAWALKEDALRARFARTAEKLNQHSQNLPPLRPGNTCFIQNQTGNHKGKWYHTGVVVDVLPHDQYDVKVDGTGRITTRNRKYLRMYTPYFTHVARPTSTLPDMSYKPGQRQHQMPSTELHPADVENAAPPSRTGIISPELRAQRPLSHMSEESQPNHSGTCQPPPSPPIVDRVQPQVEVSRQSPRPPSNRVPRMLKGLMPFNNPGLNESSQTPSRRVHRLRVDT